MRNHLERFIQGRRRLWIVLAAAAVLAAGTPAGAAPGHHGEEKAPAQHVEKEAGHGHEAAPKAHGQSGGERGHAPMPMKEGAHGEAGHGHAGTPSDLTPLQARGFKLVSDLHCNACHYIGKMLEHGKGHHGGHGGVAPDLAFLGDKFRADWLYEFLREPHAVRPWLAIRMPRFRLSETEAVALVKHLTKDMRSRVPLSLPKEVAVKGGPPTVAAKAVFRLLSDVVSVVIPPADRAAYLRAGKKLMSKEYFNCWKCHQRGEKKPEGPREDWAPDIKLSARRLRPEWIVRWLHDPQKVMPGTKMPAFFENDESGPDEILGGDEMKQIIAIREYIRSLAPKEKGPSAFERAAKRHPDASRAQGFRLMTELNCAGCHDVGGMHEREEAGPPLAHEGSRVKRAWLVGFLRKPSRIRPIGYTAGASSRMPDFRLKPGEAEAIAAYLMTRVDPRLHTHEKPHGPSPARAKRGKRLFASLRCGACHLAGKAKGGKAVSSAFRGPRLEHAGRRLQEEHLRLWLAGKVMRSGSKLEMGAHPLVPDLGLTEEQIEDLSAFVASLR